MPFEQGGMMATNPKILTYFEMIPDPRRCRITHSLVEIIAIAVLSKICGADGWEDMTIFGESRKEWLGTFLQLPGGVPCPDTFRRVISCIDPQAFLEAFLEWASSVSEVIPKMVSIDGKTLCSTLVDGRPLHIVTAWCEQNHLILGQLRNTGKSNEIKTIPELLRQLTLPPGCIITIDAAGTQREIASQIRAIDADYVLALKGNQGRLRDEAENFFEQAIDVGEEYILLNEHEQCDEGHGRIESRKVYVTDDIEWLSQKEEWKDLRSLVKLESVRIIAGKRQQESRYFITSLPPDPKLIAQAIRGHWGVENGCHWTLDVVFREDERTISDGFAPENLRAIEMVVTKMLKSEKSCKKGLKAKQFKASLDPDYLHKVLYAANF